MRLALTLLLLGGLPLGGGCGPAVGCASDGECPSGTTCVEERCRATVRLDGAAPRDAGDGDAGESDAGPGCVVGGDECEPGLECRAMASADGCPATGEGRCVAPSGGPECGCDGWSYRDATSRNAAGAGFAHEGFCDCDECADGGLCDVGFSCGETLIEGVCVEPPSQCGGGPIEQTSRGWDCGASLSEDPEFTTECARLMAEVAGVRPDPSRCSSEPSMPTGCCRNDGDCAEPGLRCYGTTGCAAAAGACLARPPPGECYSGRDCAPGYRCGREPVASCAAMMEAEPRTGACEPRPEGLR